MIKTDGMDRRTIRTDINKESDETEARKFKPLAFMCFYRNMCNLQIVLLLFHFSALSRLITAAIVIWLLLLFPIRPLCLSIVCGAMTFFKVEKIKVNFNSWYRFSSWGEERENNSGSAHDESVAAIDIHIILACKLSEITQRIRWIHASELVTFWLSSSRNWNK